MIPLTDSPDETMARLSEFAKRAYALAIEFEISPFGSHFPDGVTLLVGHLEDELGAVAYPIGRSDLAVQYKGDGDPTAVQPTAYDRELRMRVFDSVVLDYLQTGENTAELVNNIRFNVNADGYGAFLTDDDELMGRRMAAMRQIVTSTFPDFADMDSAELMPIVAETCMLVARI